MLPNLCFSAVDYRAMGESAQRKSLLQPLLDNMGDRFAAGP